jgi:hypothetical protein
VSGDLAHAPGASNGSVEELRAWLARRGGRSPESIDLDVDIIEERVVSSIDFVAFVLFVEELRGRPIPAGALDDIGSFRTLRRIAETFL